MTVFFFSVFTMITIVCIDIRLREELWPYWRIVLFFEDKEIHKFFWRWAHRRINRRHRLGCGFTVAGQYRYDGIDVDYTWLDVFLVKQAEIPINILDRDKS